MTSVHVKWNQCITVSHGSATLL